MSYCTRYHGEIEICSERCKKIKEPFVIKRKLELDLKEQLEEISKLK